MNNSKYSAVIIDDMALAISSLTEDLKVHCPDIQVVDSAEGVLSGIKLLKNISPDFLFLDIDLEDGSGFDILDILSDLKSKVIFVTGRDDFALRAFQYAAVDYLLKPIDSELLKKAVLLPASME